MSEKAVLVIDDESLILDLVGDIAEMGGFKVFLAGNGADGIETYKNNKDNIGLVLLDYTMPFMSGDETFLKLKEIDPNVQVVFSSGLTTEELSHKYANSGVAGFLQKPYNPSRLTQLISKYLK